MSFLDQVVEASGRLQMAGDLPARIVAGPLAVGMILREFGHAGDGDLLRSVGTKMKFMDMEIVQSNSMSSGDVYLFGSRGCSVIIMSPFAPAVPEPLEPGWSVRLNEIRSEKLVAIVSKAMVDEDDESL